jgi:AbrB family looped-hinge helix DNA binding protein
MATKTARKTHKVKEAAPAYTAPPTTPAYTPNPSFSDIYRLRATSKGQVVIPAALRRKYGITPKTLIAVYDDGEKIVFKPVTREAIERLHGSVKGGPSLTQALLEERAKDREREDAKFNRFR